MKFLIAKKIEEKGFIFKKRKAEKLSDDEINKIIESLKKFEEMVKEEWKNMKLPGSLEFEHKVINGIIELEVKFPMLNALSRFSPNKSQMATNLNNFIRDVAGVDCEVV